MGDFMNVKTRRKLTIRRFAYYLLIAAIVVSCVTNGIFAKFTTEDDGGDGARVAKFGVVLSVAGDLFSTTYNKYEAVDGVETDASNMPAVYTEVTKEDGISVQAHYKYVLANGTETNTAGTTTKLNNVIAPGTKNDDGLNISIQGTAETDLVVEYEITSSTICLKTSLHDYYKAPFVGTYWQYSHSQHSLLEEYSYCIMVPMEQNIIRADNFEEFKDTLYTANTVDGTTTYTRVTGDFDNNTDYYQAKDVATNEDDFYLPIIYKLAGHSSIADGADQSVIDYYKLGYNYRQTKALTCSMQYLNDYAIGQLLTNLPNNNEDASKSVFPYKSTSSGKSDVIETGTDIDVDINLIWEWPFVDSIGSEESKEVNSCDTILGHIMAGNEVFKSADDGATYTEAVQGEDYNVEVEFDINITINQVD